MDQASIDVYNEIKRLIDKSLKDHDGLGVFDTAVLNNDYTLKCASLKYDIKPGDYLVSEGLLEKEIEYEEQEENLIKIEVKKRLEPGTKYLVAYVSGTPTIIDKLRRGDEI